MLDANSEADERLTVDELATQAGVTVRTVRFYSAKGLLPPPTLRGRVGLYGNRHLSRLTMIKKLQELGFTLSAIERQLADTPDSLSPEELALRSAMLTPWGTDRPVEITRAELDARAGRTITETEFRNLISLNVLTPLPEDLVRLEGTQVLAIGLRMLDLGLPMETHLSARRIVEEHCNQMAAELNTLFLERIMPPDVEPTLSERQRIVDVLTRLRPITIEAIVSYFQRAVNANIRDRYTPR
ncbi:MerR family transcriptional regulator [Pseudonocardiaceae bacterium YIM PH 21723]|nr:MerR family transcriptional regulator [Pseudonocardiaceae bacterium YIM PH 21723]